MSPMPLTSAQIRAARALIRWSAQELATKTEVGVTTIRRAELTASETKLTRVNDQAIRRVLEAAGVEFIDHEGVVGRGCVCGTYNKVRASAARWLRVL